MYRKILVAADGSAHSIRAAEHACHLAKTQPGAQVIVLYVIDDETSRADVLRNLDTIAIAEKRLKKVSVIENLLKDANIHYEIAILHGDPGPTIIAYAKKQEMDIIMIGSRGLNLLQEFVLGSVSHKVVKRAHCPVMVVK